MGKEEKKPAAKVLSREDIFKVEDRQFKDVSVPEWGGVIRVQSMTGKEREDWENSITETDRKGETKINTKHIWAKLVMACAVDETGKRLFTEGDVPVLADKNVAALTRVFKAAQRLNGLAPGDVEELAGN